MTEIKSIKSGSSAYLIMSKGHLFMIDCGDGNFDEIDKACDDLGSSLSDIEFLVVTHAHVDHVANLKKLKEICQLKVIAQKNAQKYLQNGFSPFPGGTSILNRMMAWLLDKISTSTGEFPAAQADILVEHTYSLKNWGIEGAIHYTPGHSEDSIIIIIDKKYCFTGDTMFNHFPWTVYPMFANDEERLKNSWKYIKGFKMIEKFYPGHGEPFSRPLFIKNYNKKFN